MLQEAGPSPWAVQRFGERYAGLLWELVPQAMAAAVSRQIDTHHASGLDSLHAYGGAWPAQYAELVNHVGALDGVQVVRPAGLAVQLVMVNGSLLVPFRYADDLATLLTDPRVTQRLNKTCRALLSRFGPEPATGQLTLPAELVAVQNIGETSGPTLLSDVVPENITLALFAANVNGGLLAVGLGDAALLPDGGLQWVYSEELPLPKAQAGEHPPLVGVPPRATRPDRAGGRRFDDAPLDDPALRPRTAAEQNDMTEPPVEQPFQSPRADDDRQ